MTDPIVKVDPAGIESLHRIDIKNRLDKEQIDAFGGDLSASPHTPQQQWSWILALALEEAGQSFVAAANYATDVDSAPDQYLDKIARLLDIRRKVSTYTTVVATFTGKPATLIRAGTRAATSGGKKFMTIRNVTIGSDGEAKVTMRSIEKGAITLGAGDLNEILSPLSGVTSVTNDTPGVTGQDGETDAEFRSRFLIRTAHSSIGPKAAMLAALEEVEAGRVSILENTTSTDKIEGGVLIPSHGILVIAESGNDNAVTRAIENHRGMGVATGTGVVAVDPPINNTYNAQYKFKFNGTEIDLMRPGNAASSAFLADVNAKASVLSTPYQMIQTGNKYSLWTRWTEGTKGVEATTNNPQHRMGFGLDFNNNDLGGLPLYPFVRPIDHAISIDLTLQDSTDLPAGFHDTIRSSLTDRVSKHPIGKALLVKDLRALVEQIVGLGVTAFTAQHSSTSIDNVALTKLTKWTLSSSDIIVRVI